MRKSKLTQAFTLIELLTVMAIIMIIAGMVVGVSTTARESARKRKSEVMIAALEIGISMYHADTGNYPTGDDGTGCYFLYDLLTNAEYGDGLSGGGNPADIAGWRGPYMEFKTKDLNNVADEIIDPWGNVYNYDATNPITHNTNSFDLWSIGGSDGRIIHNW